MILVIGEEILDIFIYCKVDRMSPESCALVGQPIKKVMNSGGAGNVVENLKSLGNKGVLHICQPEVITKTRYVHQEYNQHLFRLDENDSCKPMDIYDLKDQLAMRGIRLDRFEVVVFSDYCKNLISEQLIKDIRTEFRGLIFIDTKKRAGDWCDEVDFIKINSKEYKENFNNQYSKKAQLFVTRGGCGVDWINEEINIPTEKVEVIDCVGSGDIFLSALVTEYLISKDIKKSLTFANKAASIGVQKKGVAIIKKEECKI